MNKTAIKTFAIWARNKLIADISYRAGLMGITAEGIQNALPQSTGTTEFYDIGTAEPYSISGDAVKQRNHLVELIRRKEKESNYKIAYKYILEEVAYTWFNRLIAVRFMEVNDYLPSHIRVLSSDSGKMEPDLVTTPFDAELAFSRDEEQTIYQLKQENKIDEVFRILFIKQCNALNEILPALFEKTSDYTELLLNLSVIDQDGVVYHLVHDIPEEDFDVERGGQVEIIGWLYQYYNTEPKNEAFAKSGKISKEEIPAVTQLFTPDWIVRYMVENTVGRLWIEHLRALDESANESAVAANFGWKYYLPEPEQELEVSENLHNLRKERALLTPEQITIIDPCMGSGHILVYAFDVLMQIYESAGYGQRDAAKSILDHNLFGLDIDDRACQIAYFAVMMKARAYNRRVLNGENTCKVYAIQESNGITDAALRDMGSGLVEEDRKKAFKEIKALIEEFEDAKEYGSILNIKNRDWNLLRRFAVSNTNVGQLVLDINGAEPSAETLQAIINYAESLTNQYMAIVTNPPYMGNGNMNTKLVSYTKKTYPDTKSDLSTVFMEKARYLCRDSGYYSMINIPVWMFLSSYRVLRETLISSNAIINMLHLGRGVFGSDFGTTAFVNSKLGAKNYKACFFKLYGKQGSVDTIEEKERNFFNKEKVYCFSLNQLSKIPEKPIAYWLSDNMLAIYDKARLISDYAEVRQGMATSDNERFLRLWTEIEWPKCNTTCRNVIEAKQSGYKWFPYNKGGDFRKWYGNNNFVVDYENDGYEMKMNVLRKYPYLNNPDFVVKNSSYYFYECITWSRISSSKFGVRYSSPGFIFDANGSCLFIDRNLLYYFLGFMCSAVSIELMNITNQTIAKQAGDVARLPIIVADEKIDRINELVKKCINLEKKDWDSSETSWDFCEHPLVKWAKAQNRTNEMEVTNLHYCYPNNKKQSPLEFCYSLWQSECLERNNQIKQYEVELNRLFIDIYGLYGELSPEIEDNDITVRKNDFKQDVKSLISYAVGCLFGRYSLDNGGLAYAGGNWDESKYTSIIPDADNVIPITDEEYLEDDILSRFCAWLKVVYGESTLEENLDFIAKSLGKKGNSSREIIRNYFLNDFFKDHCQTYSVTGSGKRPIYWLFDSGKQNGFKALIYLHRYNADTIGNLRIDYLHRMQRIYESEVSRMQDMIEHSTNTHEEAQAAKRREKLLKQLKECRVYDEKLAHLALSRIDLNLNDGVKINYRKIQTANDGKYYEVLADAKNIMANDKLWKQYKEGKW